MNPNLPIATLEELLIALTNDRNLYEDKALTSEYMRGKYNRNEEVIAMIKNSHPQLMEELKKG